MQTCPFCKTRIILRELPHPGMFKNFRKCPQCDRRFTVDNKTKYRQVVCIILILVSLVLTILLYYRETVWLVPALISYLAIVIIIYRGNKKVYLVPYEE